MIDDKTEEQENNNEMENNLNDDQDQPSELEIELNKATSDEEELNKAGAKFLDAGVKSSSGFERPNEEITRRRNVKPEKEEQNFELMLSDNFNSIRAKLYDLTHTFINRFESIEMILNNNFNDLVARNAYLTEKIENMETAINEINSARFENTTRTLTTNRKIGDIQTGIRGVDYYLDRIVNDITEIKDKLAGIPPAKKARAKRKKKETKSAGSPTRRGVNKVGAKRGRRPGKAYVANVSHPKRGIKKRGRGRPPATAGRKGRRS